MIDDTQKSIQIYLERKRERLSAILEPSEIEALSDDDLFDEEEYDTPEENEDEPIFTPTGQF